MNPSILIWLVGIFWLILVLYLIVAAIGVKQDTQPHTWQRLALTLAIVAAFLLPRLPIFRFLRFALANPVIGVIGVIFCAAGMAFLVWGRQCLGRNWSQTVSVKKDHELVTSGPYRYVRHPMYACYILTHLGIWFSFPSLQNLGVYAGTWVLQVLRILVEEKHLSQDPAYRAYQKVVRYRLIPGVF